VLSVYVADGGRLQKTLCSAPESMPADPVWLDMLAPTAEEDGLVEQKLGISVPTRDEMQEIEPSSRLYTENGTCYMTATLLSHAESEHPHSSAVTFILVGKRLVTVRYVEPKSFELFIARVQRPGANALAGDAVLIGLLETVIDRAAENEIADEYAPEEQRQREARIPRPPRAPDRLAPHRTGDEYDRHEHDANFRGGSGNAIETLVTKPEVEATRYCDNAEGHVQPDEGGRGVNVEDLLRGTLERLHWREVDGADERGRHGEDGGGKQPVETASLRWWR